MGYTYGHWKSLQQPKETDVGFVYEVREKSTKCKYFGIKKLKKKIRRKPLKGKKRVRIDYVESDWKSYTTSSPIMQQKIKENPDDYEFVILCFCDSVSDMKAREAYYQLQCYIDGNWDRVYNEMINLRVRLRK